MESIEEALDRQCNSAELLKNSICIIQFIKNNNNQEDILLIKAICDTCNEIFKTYDSIIDVAEKHRSVNMEIASINKKISKLTDILDSMINDLNIKEVKVADVKHNKNYENSCTSSNIPLTPIVQSFPKLIEPIRLFRGLEYIKGSEFQTIPKYMIGRIKLDELNLFVDKMNAAIDKKYSILNKKKASLRSDQKHLYSEYKSKEISELDGQTYISEPDVVDICNVKCLDKKSYNYLTILRHIKRVREYRSGSTKIYII